MREILFRGKSVDSKQWEYGQLIKGRYYLDLKPIVALMTPQLIFYPRCEVNGWVDVVPETVGQFTGLTDENGKRIFEGDIVKVQDDIWGSPFCNGITGKIIYDEAAFFIMPKDPMETQWLYNECAVYEVIGNIHDNPELLEGADNG